MPGTRQDSAACVSLPSYHLSKSARAIRWLLDPSALSAATGRQQKPDQAVRLRVSCLFERLPSIEGQPAVASQQRRRQGGFYALGLAKSTPFSIFLSRIGKDRPKPPRRQENLLDWLTRQAPWCLWKARTDTSPWMPAGRSCACHNGERNIGFGLIRLISAGWSGQGDTT